MFSFKTFILVSLGGALGTSLRFLATAFFAQNTANATFLVNILGCFLIGLLFPVLTFEHNLKAFFVIGVLGSLTTFSTFSFENLQFLQKGQLEKFLFYFLIQLCLGLTVVWLGYKITHSVKGL